MHEALAAALRHASPAAAAQLAGPLINRLAQTLREGFYAAAPSVMVGCNYAFCFVFFMSADQRLAG
jgi:hypothetical protein